MLSQIEQEMLIDFIIVVITAIFGFAIVSTLMALSNASCRRSTFLNEATKSSIVRKKCISWAKKNGKLAE